MQRYADWFRDAEGRGFPGAIVAVYVAGTTTLALLYTANGDVDTPPPIANPTTTDSNGFFSFAVASGVYDIMIQAGGMPTTYIPNLAIFEPGTVTGVKAVDVSVDPAGGITSTNVQAALEELDAEVTALDAAALHKAGAETVTGAKTFNVQPVGITAASIVNVPAGIIGSTNVQAAVNEIVTSLADYVGAVHGAGMVGFSSGLSYSANTVGAYLRSLVSTIIPGMQQRPSAKYGVTTGTSPNYILALSPALTSYTDADITVNFHVDYNAKSTVTINVNGLGAVGIKTPDPSGSLVEPQINAGRRMRLVYDGTQFVTYEGTPRTGSLGHQTEALTSNYTLNISHAGKIQVFGSAITVSLPTANSIPSGTCFYLKNEAATKSYIGLNGNNMDVNNTAIEAGEMIALQCDGGSFYRMLYRGSRSVPNWEDVMVGDFAGAAGTVYQVNYDAIVRVLLTGSFMNDIRFYVGSTSSPSIQVARFGDDLNSNTKAATITFSVPKNWYYKYDGGTFGGGWETVTIAVFRNH